MIVGYARTSTTEQKAGLAAQLRDLAAHGCEKVFQEEVSSVDTDKRLQLEAALDFLREGDVLVVTKLDRLARSVRGGSPDEAQPGHAVRRPVRHVEARRVALRLRR